jgi:hypothetical protein
MRQIFNRKRLTLQVRLKKTLLETITVIISFSILSIGTKNSFQSIHHDEYAAVQKFVNLPGQIRIQKVVGNQNKMHMYSTRASEAICNANERQFNIKLRCSERVAAVIQPPALHNARFFLVSTNKARV